MNRKKRKDLKNSENKTVLKDGRSGNSKYVKVVDLAVGSGAFPLGMLNEIVKARETLSEYIYIMSQKICKDRYSKGCRFLIK